MGGKVSHIIVVGFDRGYVSDMEETKRMYFRKCLF